MFVRKKEIKSAHTFLGNINVSFAILFNIFLSFLLFFFFYQKSAVNQSVFSNSTPQESFGSVASLVVCCSDLQGLSLGKTPKSNFALSKSRNL